MKFPHFEHERWLATVTATYDLGGSVVRSLKFKELLQESDLTPILDLEIMHPHTKGSEELREQISALYEAVDKDGIVVTQGVTEGNCIAAHYLLEPGDEFLIGVPSYMEIWGLALSLGARAKFFHLREDAEYKLDLEEIKELVSSKTKVIVLTNPNNPDGSKLSAEELRAICEIAEDVEAYVLCDEVIRGLELDGRMAPALVDLYEKGISIGGLSKLGLAGLRIGWVAADRETVDGCWAYKDYTTLAGSNLSEYVAKIALQKENYEKLMERARTILKEQLEIFHSWVDQNDQYVSCVLPKAGATTFPRYHADLNSVDFCEKLLTEEDVMLAPGDYFKSPNHVRIHYGGVDLSTLETGLDRLSQFLKRICP